MSAQFSPDGARIVTASGDKTARVWDAATGKQLALCRAMRLRAARRVQPGRRAHRHRQLETRPRGSIWHSATRKSSSYLQRAAQRVG